MRRKTFRLIRSPALPGARNMALDEALAGSGAVPVPTVRLYGWDPWALSLGWFQRVEEEDLAPFDRAGLGVTRRATGGGAILHADEVTYSVVLPADDLRIPRVIADSYGWIHRAIQEALAEVGVEAHLRGVDEAKGADPFFCFARTAAIDLVARGRKIVGSAQRRTRTAFLQHGSVPLSPNGTAPGATSVSGERGGSPVDRGDLEDALVRGFERVLEAAAEASDPAAAEEERAAVLERERYGSRAWVLRPWKGRGRAAGPGAASVPAIPAPLEPLVVLRAAVEDGGLRVLGSSGGGRPVLPHSRLRAADAATILRVEERALAVERDPWDSTFRRSSFAGAQGEAGPEGRPPARASVAREEIAVLLLYGGPEEAVRLDARRFNFADLRDRRSGDPERDARTLLADLLARAPGAAAGPGVRALLEGRRPPPLPGEGALALRAAAVASPAADVPPAKS